MKAVNCLPLILVIVSTFFSPLASRAELKTFTLDQSKSGLIISGSFTYLSIQFPFTAQGANSLTTSYTGTIETDITGSTITFVGGSLIAAVNNGNWQPGVGGTPGVSAPANYGGQVTIGGAFAAVRNALLDATSGPTAISGITFPSTSVTFNFPPVSYTTIDYSYTINGGGSGFQQLTGSYPNAINTNATLVTQGNQLILTIPVDISGTTTAINLNDIFYRLRGKVVATASVPITPIPLLITSFAVTNNQATISMDTTLNQHFTILGSTNFTSWFTNDAFTASATNTTRIFTIPSAATRPGQFIRVRGD